mgnify:CR=1 FL=1
MRIFVLIFAAAVSLSNGAAAQTVDDLFSDEDFESSEIDRMQKETAEKNAKEAAATAAASAAQPARPAAAPMTTPAAPALRPPVQIPERTPVQTPAQPAAQTAAAAPKTLSLPVPKMQAIPAPAPSLPQISSAPAPDLPDLGKGGKKAGEEMSLFEMRSKKTGNPDTDVLKLDIAGIKLKMTPEEVMQNAEEAGFTLKFKDLETPTLDKWKYRRLCMDMKLFADRSKKECVKDAARQRGSEYISRLVYENKKRRETLTVEFTSRFSDNQAFRVRYVSKGDHSLGTTDEAHYFKAKRRQEFLRLLITKYGVPDDEQALQWGVSGIGATLQAEISDSFLDASLVLEDPNMETDDFDVMSIEDAKEPAIEKFSF